MTKKRKPAPKIQKKQKKTRRASSRGATGADATWSSNPATTAWNTAANWSPATVPTDTATFGASSKPGITFAPGSNASVNSLAFAAGAAAYTLSFTDTSPLKPTLSITGAGVTNASSNRQLLQVAAIAASRDTPQLAFRNSASAGGSNMQYQAGPATPSAAGGGVIRFFDTSSAGSAAFTVTTGSGTPPRQNSTVGGEVTFSETASAETASFTVYGSTSTTDFDTFGNVVFHDNATAAQGTFTNIGGTVPGGDGGNTQFYDTATAANALFYNFGATVAKANGGDVAFDGTANAANGQFHNYASTASGGNGGVTSFNNNGPDTTKGSSAGNGVFHNYGATAAGQGGGHTYFQAKYGSPTAGQGTFINHGNAVSGSSSSPGRTVFSITLPQQTAYTPNAGSATFVNLAGSVAGAAGGLTEFTVYPPYSHAPASAASGGSKAAKKTQAAVTSVGPSAANAVIVCLGAMVQGALGGQTVFEGAPGVVTSASNANLLATGGSNGGNGGRIVFSANSSGGSALVGLTGNGTLDVSDAGQAVTIGALNLSGGVIVCLLGSTTTGVIVTGNANVWSAVTFNFREGTGFEEGTAYTILTASNLSGISLALFSGNSIGQAAPAFSITGNSLQVTFNSQARSKERPLRSRARS